MAASHPRVLRYPLVRKSPLTPDYYHPESLIDGRNFMKPHKTWEKLLFERRTTAGSPELHIFPYASSWGYYSQQA